MAGQMLQLSCPESHIGPAFASLWARREGFDRRSRNHFHECGVVEWEWYSGTDNEHAGALASTCGNTVRPAVSLHLVPIRSRSLPAVSFSSLDGVKGRYNPSLSPGAAAVLPDTGIS